MDYGRIISINGIERIGKQYYSGIINNYLKESFGPTIAAQRLRKFSFPSYTTHNGKKLASLLKNFKNQDFLKLTPVSKARFKKITNLMLENYREYSKYIYLHLNNNPENIAIINNNYFSIIAHSLAMSIDYKSIERVIRTNYMDVLDTQKNILAFFLVTNNVEKVLTAPSKSHEIHSSIAPDYITPDYINFFKQVDSYYRQIFLTYSHCSKYSDVIKPVLIEVNVNSEPDYISKTVSIMKENISELICNPIVH